MTDPVTTFRNALPARARRALIVDPRVYRALHTLADRGHDIVQLARDVITRELLDSRNTEIDRKLRYRLCRHAGLLDDQEMTD